MSHGKESLRERAGENATQQDASMETKRTLKEFFGIPLLMVGGALLTFGLMTNSYAYLISGLLALSIGALNWTDLWG